MTVSDRTNTWSIALERAVSVRLTEICAQDYYSLWQHSASAQIFVLKPTISPLSPSEL